MRRPASWVSTDGGIQLNSAIAGSFAIVEISLIVDTPATPTKAASTKVVARRRVFAANPVTQQAVSNWSISTVCVEPAGGPHTHHVRGAAHREQRAPPSFPDRRRCSTGSAAR